MNKDSVNVYKWCIPKKLSLKSSNHPIITPKEDIRSPHFNLFINNLPILLCNKANNLGVFIDSHLNFNFHKKSVENKVARLKHFLPSTSLLKLCYAFTHPHFLHG